MMFFHFLTACLLAMAQADVQEYDMCYEIGEVDPSCMKVQVDEAEQTVHFHMAESGVFEDVETMEDYEVAFGASRVTSQEACYIRGLPKSFDEQVDFVKNYQNSNMSVEDQEKVSAISIDNPDEEIGSKLANFCGELPVYRMVKLEDIETVEKRQVAVTFTRCVLFCFWPVCYHTTITLPTGSTVTFTWIFG